MRWGCVSIIMAYILHLFLFVIFLRLEMFSSKLCFFLHTICLGSSSKLKLCTEDCRIWRSLDIRWAQQHLALQVKNTAAKKKTCISEQGLTVIQLFISNHYCLCVSRWLECVGPMGTVQQRVWWRDPNPDSDLSVTSGGVVPVWGHSGGGSALQLAVLHWWASYSSCSFFYACQWGCFKLCG